MNVVRPGPSDFRRNILRTGRPQPTTMPISKTPLPAPEQWRPGGSPSPAVRPLAAVPQLVIMGATPAKVRSRGHWRSL